MAQSISLKRGTDVSVDFTKAIYNIGAIQARRNEPTLFDFSIVRLSDVDIVPGWYAPERGDYVRFDDSRWESREAALDDGIVFTGWITSDPSFEFLGMSGGEPCWGYKIKCTSDEYLINAKVVPVRTFINKSRGYILRTLLEDMFIAPDQPFDLTGIEDGGIELIYHTDQSRFWSEIAKDFGEADGYVYFVQDKKVFYVQQMLEPEIADDDHYVNLDETDPRYNPDRLDIAPVEQPIVNDLTVIGEDEPTTICLEQFVSDGYQPSHQLTYVPFGITQASLIDDQLGDDIDTNVWQELDVTLSDYIRPFEGSLNIVGGPGDNTGLAFLRSRRGIELTGIIHTRDGEIFFPPGATGVGFVGGLYTEDTCLEADLWCGWYIDIDTGRITPQGPGGLHDQYVTIDLDFHYILRRTITVDRMAGLPAEIVDPITGVHYETAAAATNAKIAWFVDVIDTTDPTNIITTRVDLGSMYEANPQFVLYAAIVPYDCHLAMNSVAVFRPQQFHVEVDTSPSEDGGHVWTLEKSPIQGGSALDGGLCTVEATEDQAKLSWYAIPALSRVMTHAPQEVTTIPKKGSVISIGYNRNEPSKARLRSTASIASEKAKFKDDGVRQLTLSADDVSPSPRTSEECLFIARAFMADRLSTRYEGQFAFLTCAQDDSNLLYVPRPGDKLACTIETPDGDLDVTVDVTQVTLGIVGKETYDIQLAFGPVSRFEDARRELIRRRSSSLQEVIIPLEVDSWTVEELEDTGFDPVPDPIPPTVNTVGPDYVTIAFGTSLPTGVDGYEARTSDSGWGQGGELARYSDYTHGFDRFRRDLRLFFKAFRDDGPSNSYSERSVMVHHIFPLRNNIVLSGLDGEWSNNTNSFRFWIPLPSSPDWGRVRVRVGGDLIYEGDGIDHIVKFDTVTALLSNGRLQLEILNVPRAEEMTIAAICLDILGVEADAATEQTFTVTADPQEPTIFDDAEDFEYDAGNTGSSITIDWENGKQQRCVLTGNCTFTFSNPREGAFYALVISQDGTGGRTMTFPGNVEFENGTIPAHTTAASKVIYAVFRYSAVSSGTYLGFMTTNPIL